MNEIISGIRELYEVSVTGPDRVLKNPQWTKQVLHRTSQAIKATSQTIDGTHEEVASFHSFNEAEIARERLVALFAGSL